MASDTNNFSENFALADGAPLKDIEFQPSVIETHDFALFNYLDQECNFHTNIIKLSKKNFTSYNSLFLDRGLFCR